MKKETLEQILQRMQGVKSLCARNYAAGFITESNLFTELARLHTMFDDGLEELGLQKVKPFTSETMERYAEDYRFWASGNDPDSTMGKPWLVRQKVNSGLSPIEATIDEKAAYFQLAREAFAEIRIYEMTPDDMERPIRHVKAYGSGDRVIVPFDCVDDGGLLACEDPRGQQFVLTDSRGLQAVIEVDARAGYEYRPMWKKGSGFHGLVSIEGYTVPGLHSVGAVDASGGKVGSVTYYNNRFVASDTEFAERVCTPEEFEAARNNCKSDDGFFTIATAQGERNEEAFRSFPRWQPYFEWLQAHPPKTLSPTYEEYVESFMRHAICL